MPVDKQILYQYIDACELVKETEEDIRKIKQTRKRIEQDIVKGSMPDFPYTLQTLHWQGLAYSAVANPDQLDLEEKLLEERKAAAQAIKLQVEAWMLTIPQRMQRIIRYKIFDEMTWAEVAAKMGRKATADSVKKEFQRFVAEK